MVPHRLALWIVLPSLILRNSARTERFFNRMLGHERLGRALDKLLTYVEGDFARPISVLRSELRCFARKLIGEEDDAISVDIADMYEVAPNSFPTGTGVDDNYDWFGCISYADLEDAKGLLSIAAYMEVCIAPRFDERVALKVGGSVDKVALQPHLLLCRGRDHQDV